MSPAPPLPPPPTLSPDGLDAYFQRTRFAPPERGEAHGLRPDLETLIALHRAHALAIPFENLAIHRGELPIRLDLPGLVDKLVHRKRGGYCFEQNTLFQAVLRTLGFEATPFEARVRMGASSVLPRTHMVVQVRFGSETWLCDVGFGIDGLIEPVPLDGREIAHGSRTYRVVRESRGERGGLEGEPAGGDLDLRVLQMRDRPGTEGWIDLYAIEPHPVQPIDLEMANWFTSTWPESKFVQVRTAQRITPEARYALRGRTLTITRSGEGEEASIEVRELADEEIDGVLRDVMGLE